MSTPRVEPASAAHPDVVVPPRRARMRRGGVPVGLAVLVLALAVVALGLGDYPLTADDVVRALVSDQGFDSTVVREWRGPRVLAAVAFGAALGVSGALFQSLTRNPLGSPDVIGFSTGSYTGVLVGLTLLPGLGVPTSVWALGAGIATALVVYLLAYRRGVGGLQLIVTGIAVTAMLSAVNVWLQLRAQVEVAMTAAAWGAGSLNLVTWAELLPALAGLVVCVLGVVALVGAWHQLELGDDAAAAHGVRVEPTRLAILIVGVALTAICTAVAGPIAFISLAAPQLARRLTGGAGLPLFASAGVGALLLLTADLIAHHVLPKALPVGLVTVMVGGAYLVVLLLRGTGVRR